MKRVSISIIFPVYNEEKLLSKNVLKVINYLNNLDCISNYEIIISDNGSNDKTKEIMKELVKKYDYLKFMSIKKRSAGLALLNGIKNSKMDYIMYYSIDLPFGLDIIKESVGNITKKAKRQ